MIAEINLLDSINTDSDNLLYKITELEDNSRKLELDSFKRSDITKKSSEYINNFTDRLPSEKAYKEKELKKLARN